MAVELVAKLRDAIDALKDHLAQMDDLNLAALEKRLPRDTAAGSAEMMTLVLVFREMQRRKW